MPVRRGKQNTPWSLISCASLHLENEQVTNKSELNKNRKHCLPTKTNTRWVEGWSSFFSARKEIALTNLLRGHKYELIFAPLYIFQTEILEYSCRLSIRQQTTKLEGLRAIFRLMQTGIFRWNGVAVFFHQRKKLASPKRSLLTQIRVDICCSLYPPNDNLWG